MLPLIFMKKHMQEQIKLVSYHDLFLNGPRDKLISTITATNIVLCCMTDAPLWTTVTFNWS